MVAANEAGGMWWVFYRDSEFERGLSYFAGPCPYLHLHLMGNLDRRGAELVSVDQEVLPIGYADLVENVRHVMPHRTVAN